MISDELSNAFFRFSLGGGGKHPPACRGKSRQPVGSGLMRLGLNSLVPTTAVFLSLLASEISGLGERCSLGPFFVAHRLANVVFFIAPCSQERPFSIWGKSNPLVNDCGYQRHYYIAVLYLSLYEKGVVGRASVIIPQITTKFSTRQSSSQSCSLKLLSAISLWLMCSWRQQLLQLCG